MSTNTTSKKPVQDIIRSKLLSTKEWKIKSGCLKRIEYESNRKDTGKSKSSAIELNILPFGTNDDLDAIKKPKHTTSGRVNSRQTMTRFSRVFKSTINTKTKPSASKHVVSRKEELLQLQELSFDKTYFNRILWDEHVRMLYLRSGKIGLKVLKQKPHLRLWMEAMMNGISAKSKNLRTVLRHEIRFLNNRYQVQRQLHFWQTLHSLTLDQLYHKKCQFAFRKKIRHDTLNENLDYVWRWFNQGLYLKVEKATKPLIISVTNWVEQNVTATKFKMLADLYYVRGLSLMHLKRYNAAFRCFRKDGEVGEFADLKVSLDRTKDNIGRIHAIKGNYRQAIKLWSERLLEITNPKEKAWLCYGIAQCLSLEENFEKAIEMSNKCIVHADQAKSHCWELNGNLLLAYCSAMLGTMREANIRNNTLTSLKAINRAYQCSVFLANVSVIRKILEIVVHIYNSFKDIDLSMLEDVWNQNLMEYARKTLTAEKEKANETKNMNISNTFKETKYAKYSKSRSKNDRMYFLSKKETNENYNTQKVNESLSGKPFQKNRSSIVNVCIDDMELHSICSPKDRIKTQMSVSFCASPITAVEVMSSDEQKVPSNSEDWITESESDDF